MSGIHQFQGRNYWFSWQDSSSRVRNTKWDWFNARNYCRKRCMDLVSFETQQEYDWVKGFVDGAVPYFWTSGRKCNFDGCDKPEFFPKNINGWFWSANQVKMGPTNGGQFHDWSHTGGWVLIKYYEMLEWRHTKHFYCFDVFHFITSLLSLSLTGQRELIIN